MRLHRKTGKGPVRDLTAQEAKAQSEAALVAAEERWPAVRQVAASLRGSRQENHFSERVAETFRSRR